MVGLWYCLTPDNFASNDVASAQFTELGYSAWRHARHVVFGSSISNLQPRDIQSDSGGMVSILGTDISVLEKSSYGHVSNYKGLPSGNKGTEITDC